MWLVLLEEKHYNIYVLSESGVGDANQNASATAPISLETLFRNASLQQQKQQGEETIKAPGFHR